MKTYEPLKFPVTVALVKQANGNKYLFRVQNGQVDKGTHVLCKTAIGEQPGVVDSIVSCKNQEALDFLMDAARVKRLEPIVATASYYYMTDIDTYYAGKGVEKNTPVSIQTENKKPKESWITVHMPNGDVYTN